ncbi:hypothetical protein MKEN_00190400 [Mycena kentingensis (nom. inval.)]|nr:hypothetical protein MKEN_00190400 [Mycena kentingensis (nom. inval.)]
MRPLSLHSSALNDAEYTLFTDNLNSLLDADAEDPDAQALTMREVRAWMRGRYPGVPTPTIDAILSLFPSKDAIRGGEFFAAQRLVLHVEAGKEVDRSLAFVQVHPQASLTAPAAPQPASAPAVAQKPPSLMESSPTKRNPFTPSLLRSKTAPLSTPPVPVLPPRRGPSSAAPVPPPRHPPLPPRSLSPPKPTGHVTSTLMKQSLQASKAGQWLKQGQVRLEQERVLQVLRSTNSTPRPAPGQAAEYEQNSSSSESEGSRGRSHPPPSTSSFEQVARASASVSGHSLQRSFDDVYGDDGQDPPLPPPTHPDRKSAPPSVSSRSSASSSRASPERFRERERPPPPPPKPRSLSGAPTPTATSITSPFESPPPSASPVPGRLTRSFSLRPSPPPVAPRANATRTRPESVHALLNGLGSLRMGESPFGDAGLVRLRRATRSDTEDADPDYARDRLISSHSHSSSSALESDSDSSSEDDEEDEGWVGVQRFREDAGPGPGPGLEHDFGAGSSGGGATIRARRAAHERDSLKWPVDAEPEREGWRPL